MSDENNNLKRKRSDNDEPKGKTIEIPFWILRKQSKKCRLELITTFLQETGILKDDEVVMPQPERTDDYLIDDLENMPSSVSSFQATPTLDDFWTL